MRPLIELCLALQVAGARRTAEWVKWKPPCHLLCSKQPGAECGGRHATQAAQRACLVHQPASQPVTLSEDRRAQREGIRRESGQWRKNQRPRRGQSCDSDNGMACRGITRPAFSPPANRLYAASTRTVRRTHNCLYPTSTGDGLETAGVRNRTKRTFFYIRNGLHQV